jgi:uncharacterized protein YaaR (DUF327 family)
MPIDSVNNNDFFKDNKLSNTISSGSKNVSSEKTENKPTFLSKFTQIVKKEWNDSLDNLLSAIERQGNELSKRRTFLSLKKYRELVGQFLKEFSSNNHELKEFKDTKNNKSYVVVKTINKKVDELAEEVMNSQVDNLIILDKIDEIKGLLIDLRG